MYIVIICTYLYLNNLELIYFLNLQYIMTYFFSIQLCICPEGYQGTSCETCESDYYKDASGYCQKCQCNGHSCYLSSSDEVICNCRPPYSGDDCSILGWFIFTYFFFHSVVKFLWAQWKNFKFRKCAPKKTRNRYLAWERIRQNYLMTKLTHFVFNDIYWV